MSRLESIKEQMDNVVINAEGIDDDWYERLEYVVQLVERYETTLQKITHTTTHLQAKFFAQEALKGGQE